MKRLVSVAAAILLLLTLTAPALALDSDDIDNLAADTLTISVGYFGGTYATRKVFTLDDLWSMNVVYEDYTFIDGNNTLIIDHVAGVPIADLMESAGIDIGSVQKFYFSSNDGYLRAFDKAFLFDTPRYCYYNLPTHFDFNEGRGVDGAEEGAVRVQSVIALADDWGRCYGDERGASFGSDYQNLNEKTRFRLIFGQTDVVTPAAQDSAKWIYKIDVMLGGAPDGVANELPDGTVGSEFNSENYGDTQGAAGGTGGADTSNSGLWWTPTGAGGTTLTAHGFSILPPPKAESENHDGGVQNWREDEMAESAVALPTIANDPPMLGAGIAAAAFFALGGAMKFIRFKRQVGGI
jgi:hypothetical protein